MPPLNPGGYYPLGPGFRQLFGSIVGLTQVPVNTPTQPVATVPGSPGTVVANVPAAGPTTTFVEPVSTDPSLSTEPVYVTTTQAELPGAPTQAGTPQAQSVAVPRTLRWKLHALGETLKIIPGLFFYPSGLTVPAAALAVGVGYKTKSVLAGVATYPAAVLAAYLLLPWEYVRDQTQAYMERKV